MSEPRPFTQEQLDGERRIYVTPIRERHERGEYIDERAWARCLQLERLFATVDALRREVSDGAAKLDAVLNRSTEVEMELRAKLDAEGLETEKWRAAATTARAANELLREKLDKARAKIEELDAERGRLLIRSSCASNLLGQAEKDLDKANGLLRRARSLSEKIEKVYTGGDDPGGLDLRSIKDEWRELGEEIAAHLSGGSGGTTDGRGPRVRDGDQFGPIGPRVAAGSSPAVGDPSRESSTPATAAGGGTGECGRCRRITMSLENPGREIEWGEGHTCVPCVPCTYESMYPGTTSVLPHTCEKATADQAATASGGGTGECKRCDYIAGGRNAEACLLGMQHTCEKAKPEGGLVDADRQRLRDQATVWGITEGAATPPCAEFESDGECECKEPHDYSKSARWAGPGIEKGAAATKGGGESA